MPPKKIFKLDSRQKTLPFCLKSSAGGSASEASNPALSLALDLQEVDPDVDKSDGIPPSSTTTPSNFNTPVTSTITIRSSVSENVTSASGRGEERKCQQIWLKRWSWLYFDEGKIYCKLCVRNGKKNTMTTGCTTFKTSSMSRHEDQTDHKAAVTAGELKENFASAVAKAYSEEDKAMMKAMKVVYWLASENLPLTKYESLMQLLKDLGVPNIDCLKISERVDYDSYYTANEILSAISEQIDEEVNEKIENSPVVTLLADESTDIANKKRMTMHARIVDPKTSVPETVYLRDVEYEDGTGQGLTKELLNETEQRNIPPAKIIGFGSDGATVMSGDDKGVKGRLKEQNAHMVHIHCMAHRLALCTSQAASDIPCMKKYQEWLTSLFYYFKASASREQELHKVQEVLNLPQLKYKEIHSVRWLSCYQAVEAVYRTLDPLISYFHQRKATKDPKAKGLLKSIASTKFIYITYLLMDVLPIVTRLCLQLQVQDVDVAKAKVAVDQCLGDLAAYRSGDQQLKSHVEEYNTNVVQVGDHYEFNGHIIKATNTNFAAVKAEFVDQLIANINSRFPQKSLLNSFFVLAMRSIHVDDNADNFGNNEIEELLRHFGEEKIHKGKVFPPIILKGEVRQEWGRAKSIVRSLHYPVDHMKNLWELLTVHHATDIPNLIKLGQIAMCLPLHTADCERTFSTQNLILTKIRNRLAPAISDKLIRVRIHGKGLHGHDFEKTLAIWRRQKRRILKRGSAVLQ